MVVLYFSPALAWFFFSRVEEVAKKKGVSMAQVSIAWQFAKEGRSSKVASPSRPALLILLAGVTAPVVGATTIDKLKDIIGT